MDEKVSLTVEPIEFLTEDAFKRSLPAHMRKSMGPDILGYVNDIITADPEENATLRDNVMGFTAVLKEGKFKLKDYVNAVRYVGFKVSGDIDSVAYAKVFPERYQKLVDKGVSSRQITSYVRSYKGNVLVCLILARTMVPVHIVNQDMYQEALNSQRYMMQNAKSEMVRMKAADSILLQLRPPEINKIELDIGYKADGAIEELRRTTAELAQLQKSTIIAGSRTVKQIAHSKIIVDAEDATIIEEDEQVG